MPIAGKFVIFITMIRNIKIETCLALKLRNQRFREPVTTGRVSDHPLLICS
jgi:hypothetical protein